MRGFAVTGLASSSPSGEAGGDRLLHDAFISYAHGADRDVARRLEAYLETFHRTRVARRLGLEELSVFRDSYDIPREAATGSLGTAIRSELSRSRFLIVLCSEEAGSSEWVNDEIEWFLQTRNRPDRILLATAHGRPEVPDEWVPEPIRAVRASETLVYGLDGERRSWLRRRYRDEFGTSALPLVAHLHGRRVGELLPHWVARQRARAWEVASAALAIATVATSLSFVAWRQYRSAEAARERESVAHRETRRQLQVQATMSRTEEIRLGDDSIQSIATMPRRVVVGTQRGRLLVGAVDRDGLDSIVEAAPRCTEGALPVRRRGPRLWRVCGRRLLQMDEEGRMVSERTLSGPDARPEDLAVTERSLYVLLRRDRGGYVVRRLPGDGVSERDLAVPRAASEPWLLATDHALWLVSHGRVWRSDRDHAVWRTIDGGRAFGDVAAGRDVLWAVGADGRPRALDDRSLGVRCVGKAGTGRDLISIAGNRVWTRSADSSWSLVDCEETGFRTHLSVDVGSPVGASAAAGGLGWLATDAALVGVDLATGQVLRRLTHCPASRLLSADAAHVWAACRVAGVSTLMRIPARLLDFEATATTELEVSLAPHHDGRNLWVASGTEVAVLDTAEDRPTVRVDLEGSPIGMVGVGGDDGGLWVSTRHGLLVRLDSEGLDAHASRFGGDSVSVCDSPLASRCVRAAPDALVLTAIGERLWVGHGTAVSEPGATSLSIVDAHDGSPIATRTGDGAVTGLWPEGEGVWATTMTEGRAWLRRFGADGAEEEEPTEFPCAIEGGIAVGGGRWFVASGPAALGSRLRREPGDCPGPGSLYRLDRATGELEVVAVGGAPSPPVLSAGRLWLSWVDEQEAGRAAPTETLAVFDPGRAAAPISVWEDVCDGASMVRLPAPDERLWGRGRRPYRGPRVQAGADLVWFHCEGGTEGWDTWVVVDAKRLEIVARHEMSGDGPGTAVVDSGRIWQVYRESGNVVVAAVDDGRLLAAFDLGRRPSPPALVACDGGSVECSGAWFGREFDASAQYARVSEDG